MSIFAKQLQISMFKAEGNHDKIPTLYHISTLNINPYTSKAILLQILVLAQQNYFLNCYM